MEVTEPLAAKNNIFAPPRFMEDQPKIFSEVGAC